MVVFISNLVEITFLGSWVWFILQTLFNLYLHNQWTSSHKPSCTEKHQIRVMCIYMEYTKVTTEY